MEVPSPPFISGLDLSESFYCEAVAPVIQSDFPDLSFAAALIGSGSEVLGLDNVMSTDHHWGPRAILFLRESDLVKYGASISDKLSEKLPRRFRGYPTSYLPSDAVDDAAGIQMLDYSNEGPVKHRVEITSMRAFVQEYISFDIGNEITAIDWLTFPDQKLLSLTAGRVFHDAIGLEDLRKKFAYYPHDVWLYLLASAWARIEQEEHLMGRAGSVGDEIGSAVIASRLVRDLMRLCFLMERRYAPYQKWFGTVFSQLNSGKQLAPILSQVLSAQGWETREQYLVLAYEYVAKLHNQLGTTETMPVKASQFHGRPYMVISKGAFSQAIKSAITDSTLRKIAARPLIGSIDQFSDSTDLLADPSWRESLCGLYSAL